MDARTPDAVGTPGWAIRASVGQEAPRTIDDLSARMTAARRHDGYRMLIRNLRLQAEGRLVIPDGLMVTPRHPGRR